MLRSFVLSFPWLYHLLFLCLNSYRTSGTLLPVILERIIGNSWTLLQKHCLFMPTLCVSILLCSRQMVQSDTSFHRMSHWSTAKENLFKETVAPSIARINISKFFFFVATWSSECPGKNLAPYKTWKATSDWRWPTFKREDSKLHRVQTCLAEGGGHFKHVT